MMLYTVSAAVLPLLFMIAAGALCWRLKLLPDNSATVLNAFVFYFTLPALVFYSMATSPIREIFRLRFLLGCLGGIVFAWGVMYLYSRRMAGAGRSLSTIRATTASFSNVAFIGLPIMLYLFDESHRAMVASTLMVLLVSLEMIPTVALLEFDRMAADKSRAALLKELSLSTLKTPLISSALAGMLVSLSGLGLPQLLLPGLKSFGMASIPCALFAIGVMVVQSKIRGKQITLSQATAGRFRSSAPLRTLAPADAKDGKRSFPRRGVAEIPSCPWGGAHGLAARTACSLRK